MTPYDLYMVRRARDGDTSPRLKPLAFYIGYIIRTQMK